MGSIRKHGKGFQVRYYSDGQRHHEPFDTEEEATVRLAEINLAKAKGISSDSKPHTIKFGELAGAVVDYYEVNGLRSLDDIEARFRVHLEPFFGKRKAVSITPANINAYIVFRKNEGAPNSTIHRELEAMKRAFRLGIQNNAVSSMPYIPHLKEDNVRRGFFVREEVDRLCSHLKKPLDSFVLFAFLTGWRKDEIRNLKWVNVDFNRGEIRIDRSKNDDGRVFPMTIELRSMLERLKPEKADRLREVYVFMLNGRQIGEFRKTWKAACHKARLPCVVSKEGKLIKSLRLFHDLRRSGVRELAALLGERRTMERTGHKTRSVLDRYNIVSDFDLTEDRKLLDAADKRQKHKTS